MEDLELIFSSCYKYVKAYALSMCLDEALAEDITQETFYKALISYDKFKGDCKIETWLCRIARNEFLQIKRKQKSENIEDYPYLSSNQNIEKSAEDKESAKIILKLAKELPSPYKEVFYMKVLGELQFSVIGEVFDKSESWARVTYFRAKQKISEKTGDING